MKNATNLFSFFLSCLILSSCQKNNHASHFLLSNSKDSVIMGAEILTKNDTDGIRSIFVNVDDPRITHRIKYYGQSIYQIKMNAMKRVSRLEPPEEITRNPNERIVDFYKKWAIKSGYINN